MPTAISSEHASLVHSPDVRVPFLIIVTVPGREILVRHVMQYYSGFRDRLIFIVTPLTRRYMPFGILGPSWLIFHASWLAAAL